MQRHHGVRGYRVLNIACIRQAAQDAGVDQVRH